ncbi:hypothetical protein EMCRGX_G021394 [Ephydatia muelleri]
MHAFQGRAIPLRVIQKGPSKLQQQIEQQRQAARDTRRPPVDSRVQERRVEYMPLPGHEDACIDGEGYKSAHPDVKEQLIKDGYRLGEMSDDEELDLIPARQLHAEERPYCSCICSMM